MSAVTVVATVGTVIAIADFDYVAIVDVMAT
jgi:hypothetical protein